MVWMANVLIGGITVVHLAGLPPDAKPVELEKMNGEIQLPGGYIIRPAKSDELEGSI
jgi:hypothetical protein